MLLSKFPKQVLTQISEKKSDADDWTVNMMRKSLKKYIENREFADLHCQQDVTESQSSVRSTTEAFYTEVGWPNQYSPSVTFAKIHTGQMNEMYSRQLRTERQGSKVNVLCV